MKYIDTMPVVAQMVGMFAYAGYEGGDLHRPVWWGLYDYDGRTACISVSLSREPQLRQYREPNT